MPYSDEHFQAIDNAVKEAREGSEPVSVDVAASRILRALYRVGEQPRGHFYAAPHRMTAANVEALIAWLQADEARGKAMRKGVEMREKHWAKHLDKPTPAWIEALVDGYRRGAMTYGSTEHDEWVIAIAEAAPMLFVLARQELERKEEK